LILLDTNIFLELLLDQKRAAECENLLELISKGRREATVTHFSVHAVEAVLGDARSLAAFLRNLEHSLGLSIYETNLSEEMAAALISEKVGLDFDDTLQYYVAKKLGVDALVSFDEHFDKLDLRRVEPRDLLRSTEKQEHSN
jgi:predicted nucleic acid-binding protein